MYCCKITKNKLSLGTVDRSDNLKVMICKSSLLILIFSDEFFDDPRPSNPRTVKKMAAFSYVI